MRKVMVYLPDLSIAGGQKIALAIVSYLVSNNNLKFQIVCLGKNCSTAFDLAAKNLGLDVIYLRKGAGLDIKTIPKLIRATRKFDPDVIHCHLPRMHYYLPAMLCTKTDKCYYTVHNLADKENAGRWHQKILRFAFRHCRVQPVAISDLCRQSITDVYGIPKQKIPCIYVGIDTKRFARAEEYVCKGNFQFVAVGRLSEQKNYPLMLNAFADIHRRFPGTKLVILGDGELRADLEQRCQQLEISDAVLFTGNVSDVEKYLRNAHAYLMSSDYEGLPQTVLEAMAAGLPIISTKAGGVIDVVEHEKNGLLVDCGDQAGLVNAMELLLQSPELCKQFSDHSTVLARKYSIESCANQYRELYLA